MRLVHDKSVGNSGPASRRLACSGCGAEFSCGLSGTMLVRRGNRAPADAGRWRRLPVPGVLAEGGGSAGMTQRSRSGRSAAVALRGGALQTGPRFAASRNRDPALRSALRLRAACVRDTEMRSPDAAQRVALRGAVRCRAGSRCRQLRKPGSRLCEAALADCARIASGTRRPYSTLPIFFTAAIRRALSASTNFVNSGASI